MTPVSTALPNDATADQVAGALERDGWVVVTNAMEAAWVAEARADLTRILESTPYGRDDFEGHKTRRIYALFAKTRTFDEPATHPIVLEALDRVLGHYQLSAPAGIEIGPGERAQPLHPDDGIYPLRQPHPEVVVNAMWPLCDFTAANGGTVLVPGSHEWTPEVPGPGHPNADTPTITIEMPAGSVLLYRGSLWHGGGANHTDQPRLGVVLHYAASWLRP